VILSNFYSFKETDYIRILA